MADAPRPAEREYDELFQKVHEQLAREGPAAAATPEHAADVARLQQLGEALGIVEEGFDLD